MSSDSRALYIGVTSNLEGRIWQHKNKYTSGHTAQYNINKLIYFEEFDSIIDAIEREKELKKWRREKKLRLIEKDNPFYKNLAEDWDI